MYDNTPMYNNTSMYNNTPMYSNTPMHNNTPMYNNTSYMHNSTPYQSFTPINNPPNYLSASNHFPTHMSGSSNSPIWNKFNPNSILPNSRYSSVKPKLISLKNSLLTENLNTISSNNSNLLTENLNTISSNNSNLLTENLNTISSNNSNLLTENLNTVGSNNSIVKNNRSSVNINRGVSSTNIESGKVPLTRVIKKGVNISTNTTTTYEDPDSIKSVLIDSKYYYCPYKKVWWDSKNKIWIDSYIFYGEHREMCYMLDTVSFKVNHDFSSARLNLKVKALELPNLIKSGLRDLNKYHLLHVNFDNFLKKNGEILSSNRNEDDLIRYLRNLFGDYGHGDRIFSPTINRLNDYINGSDLNERTKINTYNLKLEIIAQREQDKIMANSIGNRCLSMDDKYVDVYYRGLIRSALKSNSKTIYTSRPL